MDNLQKYAIDITKDIVIAKLSNSSPGHTNQTTGQSIGEMFEAIYTKVYEVCNSDKSK